MYQKTKLKNNFRVITAPMKETKAITLYLVIKAGSRYEQKEENGLSHFLEHLFFKGTKKRPDALSISRELDGIGASYNAFTAEEMTGFYIQAEKSKFPKIVDVLFDIILNSRFAQKEIDKERGVILQEMNMRQDTPMIYIFDLFKELLYGDTPLGRQVIGRPKIIKKIDRQDFLRFLARLYSANRMVIAVAGAIDEKVKQTIIKYTQKIKSQPEILAEGFSENQQKPKVYLFPKKTDQAHLILGYKTISRHSEKRHIQEVLNVILGTSMSSRLFIELREKRGLCYHVSSDSWFFDDTGSLLVYAGVKINKIDQSVSLILKEFNDIKERGIRPDELNKAKDYLKGKMALKMESSFNKASFFADQELLLSEIMTPEQELHEIGKVTSEAVKQFAKEIVRPQRLNLAVIGPYKDQKKFEALLKI